MTVAAAQAEVRDVYLDGAVGQAVSGFIWLASAAAGSWIGVRPAVLVVVVGGAFIFPLTQAILRAAGRRADLEAANPLRGLAMQIAFTVPLMLPVAGAAALYRIEWFYPAVMVVVGAHYLPFVFLYGMPAFAVLAGALVAGGLGLGWFGIGGFATGGWATGIALLAFAAFAASRRRARAPGAIVA